MKILVVTPTYAENPASGGVLVTHERIEQLKRVGDVTVLCIHVQGQPAAGVRLIQAGSLKPRTPRVLLGSYLHGQPLSVWRNNDPALMAAADDLAEESWDLVYCDHWLVWPAASRVPAPRRVLHLHNAEHVLFSRAAEHLSGIAAALASIEAHRVRGYLKQICFEADEIHLLSEADERVLRRDEVIGLRDVRVFLPSAEKQGEFQPAMSENRQGALTIGSLSWEPTRLGMTWFMRQARPHMANTPLTVIGKGASSSLELLLANDPQATALGFVADLEPYYENAKCFIAPLLDGSGIKIKILNALARGVPVVTTSVGIEGFPKGFEGCVRVADDPKAFAQHVQEVTALPPENWHAISLACQQYIKTYFAGSAWARWCNNLKRNE